MLKVTKACLTVFLVFVFGVGFSLADDRDRKQDRKRDGSCQGYLMEQDGTLLMADDQDRTRKRTPKRDGSCRS